LKVKFKKAVTAAGYSQVNVMGLVACQAAYEEGGEWLSQLKEYIYGNLNYLRSYLEENIPQIKLIEPEGTYLIWLDFSELGMDDRQLEDFIVNKSGLWLDSGYIFGPEGEGFQRINIACPRKTLERALGQLKDAVKDI
jgi:cystathionine beta-lyase